MAGHRSLESDIAAAKDLLAEAREAAKPLADILAGAARGALPDETDVDAAVARARDHLERQQACELATARIVAALSDATEARAATFEGRETPTRLEKFLAVLSSAAVRRIRERRWRDPRLARDVRAFLGLSDELLGLLKEHRDVLVSCRRRSEADLVQAIRLRKESSAGASRPSERLIEVFQGFVASLNSETAACNILINKLTIDSERRILLAQAMQAGAGGGETGEPAASRAVPAAPHIAPLIALSEKDMLSSADIDRRRHNADEAFRRRFDILDKSAPPAYVRPESTGDHHA